MFSPIIRSTWLYLQLLIYSTVMTDNLDNLSLQCTVPEAVNTVKCSWWWAKTSPETCRADWVQINKLKVASCWLSITKYTNDAWIHKHQNYIILTTFPQQTWLRERASMLRYTHIACFFKYIFWSLTVKFRRKELPKENQNGYNSRVNRATDIRRAVTQI